jgi:hypothetical protein
MKFVKDRSTERENILINKTDLSTVRFYQLFVECIKLWWTDIFDILVEIYFPNTFLSRLRIHTLLLQNCHWKHFRRYATCNVFFLALSKYSLQLKTYQNRSCTSLLFAYMLFCVCDIICPKHVNHIERISVCDSQVCRRFTMARFLLSLLISIRL